MDLICKKCGQNHVDTNRKWCDRSDLEIEFYYLKAKNKKLRDALEFYAEPQSWCKSAESNNCFRILPHDREETPRANQTGGKLARKVFKELGE